MEFSGRKRPSSLAIVIVYGFYIVLYNVLYNTSWLRRVCTSSEVLLEDEPIANIILLQPFQGRLSLAHRQLLDPTSHMTPLSSRPTLAIAKARRTMA